MEKDVLTTSWKLLMLRGLIGVVFGIVAIAWPEQTSVVVVVPTVPPAPPDAM